MVLTHDVVKTETTTKTTTTTKVKRRKKMKSLWIHLLFIAVSSNTGRICLFITTFQDSRNPVFTF